MSNSFDPDQAGHFVSLIWVQTVSKGSQQTTLVGKEFKLSEEMRCPIFKGNYRTVSNSSIRLILKNFSVSMTVLILKVITQG